MAYTQEQWLKAKGFFEAGKPLSYIQQETGISKASISTMSKKENWEKSKTEQITEQLKTDIIDLDFKTKQIKQKTEHLTEQISKLEDYQIEVLSHLVEDSEKQKSILFTGLNMAMIRATQKLQSNRKKEMLKIKEGFGVGISQERYEEIESDLSSSDIQDYTNTLIKAGQGLGLIEKDGASVNINNTNAIQTNTNNLTLEQAEAEALKLGIPLEVLLKN